MKKIFVLLLCLLAVCMFPIQTLANESDIDVMYNGYREKVQNITGGKMFSTDKLSDLISEFDAFYGAELALDTKACLHIIITLVSVNLLSLISAAFVSKGVIKEIIEFSCYCVSSMFIISFFKNVADVCNSGIGDLTDLMSISFPVLTGLIASSGFTSTASSMQINFNIISFFITKMINDILIPLLYGCGILSIVDGMTDSVNIHQFIALVKKIVKYIIGIVLTVFAGILTFTGFTSVTADNLVMKTAKYAVANFVPVVGACLSEALSSMVHSSAILKNSIGMIGFSAIIAVCFYPIVKTAIYLFAFKLASSILVLMSAGNTAKTTETMSDILEMMLGMFLIITVIFVLIITIIVSIGI